MRPSGGWRSWPPGAVDAVSCDLFDRGTADLVICNASEYSKANDDTGSFILRRGRRGFAAEPDVRLATTHAHGMVCADLDRDGYLDLVFGGFGEPDLLFFYGGPDGFDAANPRRLRYGAGRRALRRPALPVRGRS